MTIALADLPAMAGPTVNDEPDQGALLELEVDADDGCVWLVTRSASSQRRSTSACAMRTRTDSASAWRPAASHKGDSRFPEPGRSLAARGRLRGREGRPNPSSARFHSQSTLAGNTFVAHCRSRIRSSPGARLTDMDQAAASKRADLRCHRSAALFLQHSQRIGLRSG